MQWPGFSTGSVHSDQKHYWFTNLIHCFRKDFFFFFLLTVQQHFWWQTNCRKKMLQCSISIETNNIISFKVLTPIKRVFFPDQLCSIINSGLVAMDHMTWKPSGEIKFLSP